MAVSPLRVLSLCAGIGGLDLGVRLAAPCARTVCDVEREAFAVAVLVARMQDGLLDDAPVWSDLATFDGHPWRGAVDLVVGGFPCQDISNAGARAGITGERSGLWFEVLRVIREVGPRYVYLENVAALTTRGLDTVLGCLAEAGFDAEWLCLTAASVGASHKRDRWFCLGRMANTGRERGERWRGSGVVADSTPESLSETRQQRRWDATHTGVDLVADADRERSHRYRGARSGEGARTESRGLADNCRTLAAPGRIGRDGWPGQSERRTVGGVVVAGSGAGLPLFPPGPGDGAGWADILGDRPDLAPATEPGIRIMVDGIPTVVDRDRLHRLAAQGNAVVALQACAAFIELARRLGSACELGLAEVA